MKKMASFLLSVILVLSLAACGGDNGGGQAPDLNKYYEDFMASLGEENQPAMLDVDADMLPMLYPGLEAYATKQSVLKTAMIASVPYEFALVELENASDAQAVADIFNARKTAQVEGGAFYPETVEGWQKAEVFVRGSVVALICAGGEQADAISAFDGLF